jgi:uncharacterized protein YneF (UPF0154 family)
MWFAIIMVVVAFAAGVVVGQYDNVCQRDPQVKMRMAP